MRWALALLISAAGLWVAFRGVDVAAMRDTIRNLASPAWLMLVPAVGLMEFILRTWRWQFLLAPLRRVRLREFLPVTAASFFLNNVLPFRAGEAARVYWTKQKSGLPVSSCLAVLAVDRLFDMMAILTMVLFILWKKAHLFSSLRMVWFFGVATLGGLAFLIMIARFPEALLHFHGRRWFPSRLADMASRFMEGAAALRSGKTLVAVYLISIAFWGMNLLLLQKIAHVFSLPLSLVDTAWVMAAFCLGALLPSAPGYVGTLEAAGVTALMVLGYDKARTFPFVFTLHFAQIIGTVLWGIPSLLIANLRVSRLPSNSNSQLEDEYGRITTETR